MKTWKAEALVVGLVLLVTAIIGGGGFEFVGAAAVLCAFMHGQVTDRMHEDQVVKPTVACRRWMWRYWVAKELLFITYFIAHESYAAVVGAGLFAVYPLWRKVWRKYHPIPKIYLDLEAMPTSVGFDAHGRVHEVSIVGSYPIEKFKKRRP